MNETKYFDEVDCDLQIVDVVQNHCEISNPISVGDSLGTALEEICSYLEISEVVVIATNGKPYKIWGKATLTELTSEQLAVFQGK